MQSFALLIAVTFLSAQEKPSQQDIRALIEKLRSESIEERDTADRHLRALGLAAKPELGNASRDPDSEIAARARRIIAIIDVVEILTPGLRKAVPGIEERLTSNNKRAWMNALLEAEKASGVKAEDLDVLAVPALKGTASLDETRAVCEAIRRWKLRSAGRELLEGLPAVTRRALLGDPFPKPGDDETLALYINTLATVATPELVPDLVRLIAAQNLAREPATVVLVKMGKREAIPHFIKLLSHEDLTTQVHAAKVLEYLEAKEAIPHLMKILEGKSLARFTAARTLGTLGARDAIPSIVKLLKAEETRFLHPVLDGVTALRAKEAVPGLIKLLKHERLFIRRRTLETLAAIGAKEAVPAIVPLLDDPDKSVTIVAAHTLCQLGSIKPVDWILDEKNGGSLTLLNALRQPRLWDRFRKKKAEVNRGCFGSAALKIVAKEAGLKYDGPNFYVAVSIMVGAPWTLGAGETPRLPLTETLLRGAMGQHEVVLEDDRIRVLSREDAKKFWREWWIGRAPRPDGRRDAPRDP